MPKEFTHEVKIDTIRLTADAATLSAAATAQLITLPVYGSVINFDNYGETAVTIRMRGDVAPKPGINIASGESVTLEAPKDSVYKLGDIAINFTEVEGKTNGLEIVIESYIAL